jgi:pimeloyl-ACP methyl ester carboxylesterase
MSLRAALTREGGLASPEALPNELAEEFDEVGARRGHYRGFLHLLAHERLWPKARDEYASIKVPVLLVYGEYGSRRHRQPCMV